MDHTASRQTQPTLKLLAPRAIMVSSPMDHPMDSNHQLVVCSFVVSSFGLLTSKCVFIFFFYSCSICGYNAAPAAGQSYSQPVQGYGAASYDSTTAAASTTSSNQTSYGGQASYGSQSAYPGYGQQPASAAPPRYLLQYLDRSIFFTWIKVVCLHAQYLFAAVTVLAASSLLDTSRAPILSSPSKALTPSSSSNREDIRGSKEDTDSRAPTASREAINKLLPSNNRLHLPAMLHLLALMDSLLLASMDSREAPEEDTASQITNHPASMVRVILFFFIKSMFGSCKSLS